MRYARALLSGWLQLLVGRMKAGMAYINVLASMIFAGVSGTAVSDVASLGRIEIELMRQSGYDPRFSAALTAASSIAGPIIPPSVAMVIYALAAGKVSIGGLFLAGAIPGILLGAGLLVMSYVFTRKGEYAWVRDKMRLSELIGTSLKVIPLLFLPIIIVGGVVSGVFTVTESAAVGVAYVLAVGFLITGQLRIRHIYEAIIYSAEMSAVLALLLSAGAIASWILTRNQATAQLTEFLVAISHDPLFFLFVMSGALILLGMVMDATAIIIALAPILAPIALSYGISSLQFGLVFVMTVMIGLITPPVGIVLFLTSSISGVSVEGISRAIIPFVLWEICVVVLAILIPEVSLWLPGIFGFF